MTNTKAIFILLKAFFFTQCNLYKKRDSVWSIIWGIIVALILTIENYRIFYLIIFILIERSINFFLLRRDLNNDAKWNYNSSLCGFLGFVDSFNSLCLKQQEAEKSCQTERSRSKISKQTLPLSIYLLYHNPLIFDRWFSTLGSTLWFKRLIHIDYCSAFLSSYSLES